MRIAYVHELPLEYYPPARNALTLMSRRAGWQLRAWSSKNRRGLAAWQPLDVGISRPRDTDPGSVLPLRIAGYLAWHLRTASELAAWKPDALISVEPHSALGVWMYYRIFRGAAPLFIHHHEYYAPEDFLRPGMRVLRSTMKIERDDLFARARWVSQTNADRLRLLLEWNPRIGRDVARVWPNYPPREWIERAAAAPTKPPSERVRFVYLGSASFEDTFIREAVEWIASRPDEATLHVAGDNIADSVREWLQQQAFPNITFDFAGLSYDELPGVLTQFDAGLVLYRGNTLNFVHNVPNKAVEYLACGLEVWYPPEMHTMCQFRDDHPGERLREVNFFALPVTMPEALPRTPHRVDFPFTSESAIAPLLAELERLATVDRG